MGFVSISHDQAKFAHAEHYSKPFEVVAMKRSGQWDFPPFSWVYGISDFGSWDGLISTDGEKIIVTRSKWKDKAEVSDTFTFNLSEVNSLNIGTFKTTFKLNKKIKGLTKGGMLKALLPITIYGIVAFPFMPSKILQIRTEDTFGNVNVFNKLISK